MPQVPDVSAIVEQVKARIKQIEGELARHERLSDELGRLRDALGRLEGAGRARVSRARRGRPPQLSPRESARLRDRETVGGPRAGGGDASEGDRAPAVPHLTRRL
jgi:hypothetical protein